MKNHHEVGHFKNRLMIVSLSLFAAVVMAGQSYAATTCISCHGMPPLDSVDGSRQPATGAFKGSHQQHMGANATPDECAKCHGNSGYNNDHAVTSGYMIQIKSKINSATFGEYSKSTPFPQSAAPVLGSCSNVNCHFERNKADRTPAPVWGQPITVNCNTCHATPRDTSGSHKKHEDALGGLSSCVSCHPSYGTTNFSHATSAGKDKIKVHAALAYDGGSSTSWLPSQPKLYGSCTTNTCHDNGQGVAVITPTWGNTVAACSACHASAPATRSHSKHLSGLASGFSRNAACADCHKNYVQGLTTDPAKHLDGNVDVYYTTVGDLGYPSVNPNGDTPNSCSTVYCHSNGRSTFTPVAWGNTNSVGCSFCHPSLSAGHNIHIDTLLTEISFYAYTSTKSTSTGYKFGCASCHPLSVASHMNNSVDVDLTASASGGHLKAQNGSWSYTAFQCNNVYCHSNGYKPGASFTFAQTPVWGGNFTGDRCAACHGNSPNSTIVGSAAHTAHVVGIHYDDIFNGVSKKLPFSGGSAVNAAHGRNNRSTTINCNICHAATMTTSANDGNTVCGGCHNVETAPLKNPANLISDTSKHVNGTVDVVFISQKIATKAQVANTAFAAYTANASGWSRNSNSMNFKTYTSSYDYTKLTLSAAASPYTTAAGCLNIACHASIPVKWTDTVTCTSCHTRLK